MSQYLQKILFGGPGIGKSHKVRQLLEELNIDPESANCIKTVFHPEYNYGDFMGKLLPITVEDKIQYKYYAGHFLEVLAKAYKNILINRNNPDAVALVIDEINRGNSAAIFGTAFQLLDRDELGWSCYSTKLSEMEYIKLLELIGIKCIISNRAREYEVNDEELKNAIGGRSTFFEKRKEEKESFNEKVLRPIQLMNMSIRIPPNMSVVATMNTSDNSIFYMDSAFKRRWDWEFIEGEKQISRKTGKSVTIARKYDWCLFVDKLNQFFIRNSKFIRQIEDKQIGYWFIKAKDNENIELSEIKNKLLFFIWDSVFSRDKKTLADILNIEIENLITFSHFTNKCDQFIENILASK